MISRMLRYIPGAKPKRDPSVYTIQEMLNFLGFRYKEVDKKGNVQWKALEVDGIFGKITEQVVINFQHSEGILRDGVVGPGTMAALEAAWTQRQIELQSPGVGATDGTPGRMVFVRVEADQYNKEGYQQLSLRSDAANAYEKARKTVIAKGGILTSSGGLRSLTATVNSSRSATSTHYLGRALDLYIYSGMVDPTKDPYVLSREKERVYRVWARCEQRNDNVKLPRKRTIKNVVTYDERTGGAGDVEGHFIDLTSLFEENGFKPIQARRQFEEGASMMGAEWWHFQYIEALIPEVSTFGSELLKVYAKTTLEGTPPWKHRERIFGINWF